MGLTMPEELREQFAKSEDIYLDIKKTYISTVSQGQSSKAVLEKSIEHHAKMCAENSEDVYDAYELAKKLGDDIDHRLDRYAKCISRSTHNFMDWLRDDYRKKLRAHLRENFDTIYEGIHGHPPVD